VMSQHKSQKKTVLITGSSSGIGLWTALYFHQKGWNVIASMRNAKERQTKLHEVKGIDVLDLDVTDDEQIGGVVDGLFKRYGRLDVVVNNAGFGAVGPFEGLSKEQAYRQYETNFFSVLEMCRRVLPIMRKQRSGVIINVSSIAGRMGFPKHCLYSSSKWALEGFSESLSYEVRPFGIKIKIVEPGLIKTDFYGRSKETVGTLPKDYESVLKDGYIFGLDAEGIDSKLSSHPKVVAKTIFRAATDTSHKMRYRCDRFSLLTTGLRKMIPDDLFLGIVRLIHYKKF